MMEGRSRMYISFGLLEEVCGQDSELESESISQDYARRN